MMRAVTALSKQADIQSTCAALGVPKASYYRWQKKQEELGEHMAIKKKPPLKLSDLERQAVLNILNNERFVDQSPGEIFNILLDEGTYLCSERTMYRILTDEKQVRDRRTQSRTNHYEKPELLAEVPNQVWSWDITKLKGPQKWSYFYLYVIIDIYSRYVVGWMVADRESAGLAQQLISETCRKQGIYPGKLTIHADRGSSMKSKAVAHLLADLGVTKTHSRPYTSDDNPFSEAQFKTLKYCPEFPKNFGCIQDSQVFCRAFFKWYNHEHRHSGINRLTPSTLHHGVAQKVLDNRNRVLAKAYEKNANRFKHKKPNAGEVPKAVWINPPTFASSELEQKIA